MNDPAPLWADPRLVYTVAAVAVALLVVTIWLFGRRRRQGRQAGVICLILSIGLHIALLFLVPMLPSPPGGSASVDEQTSQEAGIDAVSFSNFDPDREVADASGNQPESIVAPLPVANLTDLLEPSTASPEVEPTTDSTNQPSEETTADQAPPETLPTSLAESPMTMSEDSMTDIESQLAEMLASAFTVETPEPQTTSSEPDPSQQPDAGDPASTPPIQATEAVMNTVSATAPVKSVAGGSQNDFANRTGSAKTKALLQTGGDADTEAAVAAALKFLADAQRPDGAWDPRASGAGVERSPLGMNRHGAGARAETAITGLALLTLMGAGHTHHQGEYSDNVYRGLAYLIRQQHPNGSLAGNAAVYSATYCHGMAALAICEAAAITRDRSAILAAQRAINYTRQMQHPSSGGWRYHKGDAGDLSQLGWQAMVLDAGHRAEIPIDARSVAGVQRFLRSVRMGSHGGLASYRPGEAPSRTMTAEAMATRLLIGEPVTPAEIAEAERYMLQQIPGVGQDNYYYWYYATLALHQQQDDAWQRWNKALKQRLLATQNSDGSWPSHTLWGGYGGTVYTTSMASLCLETYYRHTIRANQSRIAGRPHDRLQGQSLNR